MAGDTADWPVSAHFLRGWLQSTVGFAFAVMAIALVGASGIVALRLALSEKVGETLVGSTHTRARAVLAAYLAISTLAVAGQFWPRGNRSRAG